MRILVDMDNVLTDFEGAMLAEFRRRHPELPYVQVEDRNSFNLKDQYLEEHVELLKEIYHSPGFFRSLPLVKGGIESLKEMKEEGHHVFICTASLKKYENCVLEKYQWVEENLGRDWTINTILTRDKTIIDADYLIDDRVVTGIKTPTWNQILFDRPFNSHIEGMRRLKKWSDWKTALRP